jgi:hypothetical protein
MRSEPLISDIQELLDVWRRASSSKDGVEWSKFLSDATLTMKRPEGVIIGRSGWGMG